MYDRTELPNEEDCPVSLEMLGRLMKLADSASAADVMSLSVEQRVQLALFCYRRGHLRSLAMKICRTCTEQDFRFAAGTMGVVLYKQATSSEEFTAPRRSSISLARSAA